MRDSSANMVAEKTIFIKKLIEWHTSNNRDFSWRNTKNIYEILVAEIMLQKTDVKKVAEIYPKFIENFPNIEAVSKSSIEEISHFFQPLGIYNQRAKRMKKIAEIITTEYGGEIPVNKSKLKALPGVGEYISNAVLCLAFNKPLPMLDTNSIRVLSRVFGVSSAKSRPRTDKKYWQLLQRLITKGKAKEINLSLLDFGATVCTASKPKCHSCPMRDICKSVVFYESKR